MELRPTRYPYHHRRTNSQLKVRLFGPFRVFPKLPAMITGEDHNSVILQFVFFQHVHNVPEQVVNVRYRSVIGSTKLQRLIVRKRGIVST